MDIDFSNIGRKENLFSEYKSYSFIDLAKIK